MVFSPTYHSKPSFMDSSKSTKTSESLVLLILPKQLVLGFFQFHEKCWTHAWVVPVSPKSFESWILPIPPTLWVLGSSNSYKTFMSDGFFHFHKHADFDSWVLTIPPKQVFVGFFQFHKNNLVLDSSNSTKYLVLGFFLFHQGFHE